ncbi:MAG: carboxypeptidase-like regulatory domain-containing protein, partial [Bacteroidales bacterium]|nr:carboxypeptidase-like regulatory domain-containing protein [Bacteroidales bacterium]
MRLLIVLSASCLFGNAANGNPRVLSSKNVYNESDRIIGTRGETDANVFGHVLDANTKEHLPYVTIQLKGTTEGTTTDASGHYFIKNLPIGQFTILAQYMGYETLEKEVILEEHKTIELNFELKPALLSLDEVVVSANRNETSRKM